MHHLRRWGAVYILAILWIAFAIVQWLTNLIEYSSEQAAHGLAFSWSEFSAYFFARFAENHASESWQLAVQAILIVGLSRLLFRKGDEDIQRVETKLDALCRAAGFDPDCTDCIKKEGSDG